MTQPPAPAPPRADDSRSRSIVLVVLQFVLIALLISPVAELLPRAVSDLPGAACLIGAVALAMTAFITLRRSNFSVMPEPRPGAGLIEHGPYARIRHPMYAAVLLGGLGAALIRLETIDGLQLALLIIVMVAKLQHEERLLLATHPGYAAYRNRTAALVPGLY